jgi:membrane associated rhomboid family serine protease
MVMMIPLDQSREQPMTAGQANARGLILSSAGIFHKIQREGSGWRIWVHEYDHAEALFHIAKYQAENPPVTKTRPVSIHRKVDFFNGLWVAVLLLAIHIAVKNNRDLFVALYGADASKITSGEFYRTVTALLLHADGVHLMGNMAAVAFFGSVVCSMNGAGAGWLLILISGIFGNYANAQLHQSLHTAIGSSTAIFGAVGMMPMYQFRQKITKPQERYKAWLALGAGLGLLAMLGTGEGRVDILAHLFGFGAGLLIQIGYEYFLRLRQTWALPFTYQSLCVGTAIAIILLSCLWPLFFNGWTSIG